MTSRSDLTSLLLLLIFIVASVDAAACNHTYTALPNGQCVKYFTTRMDYTYAERACKQEGGHLVSIHDLQSNNYVRDFALSYNFPTIIIGLQAFGPFQAWSDDSAYNYNNFAKNNPNSNNGACVALQMHLQGGQWTSVQCDVDELPFVCSNGYDDGSTTTADYDSRTTSWFSTSTTDHSTTTSPSTTTTAEPTVEGACDMFFCDGVRYQFVCDIMAPQDALTRCTSYPIAPASIRSSTANACIRTRLSSRSDLIMIGMYANGTYKSWLDGNPVGYTNFLEGYPNGEAGLCVAINVTNPNAPWVNVHCTGIYVRGTLCENTWW